MDNDSLTLYKLMVLYMLDKVSFPLSNAQITDFMVGREYSNYFRLQEAFSDMTETDMVRTQLIRNNTFYSLSPDGKSILEDFGSRIPRQIRVDIDKYLQENKFELKDENEITADYYPEGKDYYIVECTARDKKEIVARVTLSVTDESEAITVCDNWQKKYQEVYDFLIRELMIKQ